jgi:hypothetical protein
LQLSDEDLFKRGLELKDQGNQLFKAKDFTNAYNIYVQAMMSLEKIRD